MKTWNFDDYDIEQLYIALHAIEHVYNYNYGVKCMRREVKRLETILIKLKQLLNEE